MKQLFLLRHAKSNCEDPQMSDMERELTEQGKHQAETLAMQLKKQHVKPDLILCSCATRAQQTAKILIKGLGLPENKIEINPKLYEESLGQLIEIVKAIPEQYQRVFIVAHNPTLSWFATYLNNNEPVNLSTCGLFAMQFDMDAWSKITEVDGKVLNYP